MEVLVAGRLAETLKAGRSAFNARFAQARHVRPSLDPAAFTDLLRSTVVPIAQAVDQHCPDQTGLVVHALYDLSLDLLGQGFLGPQSRYPFVAQGWQELLPGVPRYIAAAPRLIAGSITNALYNLSITPGARPDEWLRTMLHLSALCADGAAWLRAGQVAAWRAGLAHYRRGALELCKTLEPAIACAALGVAHMPDTETLISRLQADPWLLPAQAQNTQALKLVARVGAFRGLGGLFLQPPTVAASGEHFVVTDGNTRWLLVADAFGATWHRADSVPTSTSTAPFSIDHAGRVTCGPHKQTFPELARMSSAASNGTTLAVTVPLSFAVHLVALGRGHSDVNKGQFQKDNDAKGIFNQAPPNA